MSEDGKEKSKEYATLKIHTPEQKGKERGKLGCQLVNVDEAVKRSSIVDYRCREKGRKEERRREEREEGESIVVIIFEFCCVWEESKEQC